MVETVRRCGSRGIGIAVKIDGLMCNPLLLYHRQDAFLRRLAI